MNVITISRKQKKKRKKVKYVYTMEGVQNINNNLGMPNYKASDYRNTLCSKINVS